MKFSFWNTIIVLKYSMPIVSMTEQFSNYFTVYVLILISTCGAGLASPESGKPNCYVETS